MLGLYIDRDSVIHALALEQTRAANGDGPRQEGLAHLTARIQGGRAAALERALDGEERDSAVGARSSVRCANQLPALRDARAKARENLTKAQAELKELLTARQEAMMVAYGMLE